MSDIKRGAFAELEGAAVFAIARLRQSVFVVEQECLYPDLDHFDTDPATVHFWVEGAEATEAVACLRVLADGDGWIIGRVCAALSVRGTGLSARLMAAAMESLGPEADVTLGAQTYAAGFYRKFGFAEHGEEYLEDGIMHVPMRRIGAKAA
ncbi:MAG TPA: GNAT family N-acetyltransferase [Glycomyces sp.]|nr:GNAT family N-acetyltransferase [Glycomyces sp.]